MLQLSVLAESLKRVFPAATILTGYGMTECMPISSPPQDYKLFPAGSSGTAVGPDIAIADEDIAQELPLGATGNIFIHGPPCFGGYLNNMTANESSFISLRGKKGWFNTGDCGYIDSDGYIFLTGRSKEIINRGGETISPFEIEEVVVQHPHIKETLTFSTPHDTLQVVVAHISFVLVFF
jgi:acyl-CoA synthetase (AMP-forming)/AMP-acid ligase II